MNGKMLLIIISVATIAGCDSNGNNPNQSTVDLLAEFRDQAIQSQLYPYFNSIRADRQAKTLKLLPYNVPLDSRKDFVLELLQAGENKDCIQEVEKILKLAYPGEGVNRRNLFYHKVLGLAYFRLGEQENCISQHSPESCIIPIEGGGIHKNRRGAEQALSVYARILEAFPKDLQSRWFLNLAHMTLGSYPESVPSHLLIPPMVFASDYPLPRFADRAMEAGVNANGHAGGCSLEDFNGDGLLDIFATSYVLGDQCRLFLNKGNGAFRDATKSAHLKGITGGLNNIHGDYNNDGFEDIFITRGAWLGNQGKFPNSLLRNNGDGTFTDVTAESGILSFHPTQTAAWADFNLDGHLDLFVGNESGGGTYHPCEFFVNNGDGTFTEMAVELGIEVTLFVKGVCWGDVNNDGLPDLFLSIFGGTNKLFVNLGGTAASNWHFEEQSASAGVTLPVNSFPAWFWDYDNDGWQDLFVSGYHSGDPEDEISTQVAADYLGLPFEAEHPRIFRNEGDGTFSDQTDPMGLVKPLYTMGCNYGDLDNDGYPDFYLGTGEFSLWAAVPNRMFRNQAGRSFQDVTTSGGFGQLQKGHGVAFGDIDGDGDQDLYTVIGGAVQGDIYHNMLLENPGNQNNWITLKLVGTTSNRSAIGARLKIIAQEENGAKRTIYSTVSTGGTFGASSLQVELGLGTATEIETIEIRWPNASKTVEIFQGAKINRLYRVTEGTGQIIEQNQVSFSL